MVAEYLIVKGQIKSPRMMKMSLPDISVRKRWNQKHAPVVEKLDTLLACVSHFALIVRKTIHQVNVPPARSHVFYAKAERREINLRTAIPSRRPLFASTSNQKEASPVNDSNMQSNHIITEPIKDDAVTRTMPATSLQNQNE
uniref:Uncharacterized protein n=1 Tax=Oryza sativa subsp. japonica TaxID=39947 RepID=Q67TV9_ORYSJ|nr:hypothetical protein [Oryza sativa Japonica Group]